VNNLAERILTTVKRGVSVSALALATARSPNLLAELQAVPALPVATVQAPKRSVLANSATPAAAPERSTIGCTSFETCVRRATDNALRHSGDV
jgi:hypothetical protein